MNPRIVHLIPHDGVGGVEVAARGMAARPDLECRFTLLLIAGRSLAADTSRIVESPYRSTSNPLAMVRAIRTARALRPDVLVFSLWRSVLVALCIRVLLPRTRLAFFLNLDRPAHIVDAILSRVAIAMSHEIWADSAATLEARLGKSGKPSRVVSFVTERLTAPDPGIEQPSPHFVSWSRLNRQKGIDRALHYVAQLAARKAAVRFDIWGPDDGERQRLEKLAQRLGLGASVVFRGPATHSALAKIAGEASFFLQLSRAEGMAMATVEAMQLGLVPIVTPVGEMGRYVQDGVNGIVVDVEDMAPGVEDCLRLLEDPAEYGRLRINSIATWTKAPIYAEDVCKAATALAAGSVAATAETPR